MALTLQAMPMDLLAMPFQVQMQAPLAQPLCAVSALSVYKSFLICSVSKFLFFAFTARSLPFRLRFRTDGAETSAESKLAEKGIKMSYEQKTC